MNVAQAIGAAELPLKRSNVLLDKLWTTMKNTARWRLTTGVLNTFIGGLQSAFGYAKNLDESLNDIRIVTGKSADEMAKFAIEANKAAKELSTTTTTYTDASLIYYQQGLSDEEVKNRTDTTIKMANVTRQSAETISSQMTAVWNNFREGSRTLESYADTMVALGASTASSSKEIAEGLEKFAPIADSVGLSFDYASAALATLVATTRESASVAGNALKTLFSRLEGLKLGETLEDGTDLNKYSQALYTVGINIKDTNGELKDMDVILTELGNRWKDLARDEQMALAQTVGGVRQYAQLVALMDNWETFQQNLTTARTAEGSLEKQAQIYAESWEAARDRVKAAAEDVYDSLINAKTFTDLNNLITPLLKGLSSILDAVGGLTGLIPILITLMNQIYSNKIAQSIRDMAVNLGIITNKEQERVRALQAQAAEIVQNLNLNYDDQKADSLKNQILADRIKIQGEINQIVDTLTDEQKDQINNELYILSLLEKEQIRRAELVESAKDEVEATSVELFNFDAPKNSKDTRWTNRKKTGIRDQFSVGLNALKQEYAKGGTQAGQAFITSFEHILGDKQKFTVEQKIQSIFSAMDVEFRSLSLELEKLSPLKTLLNTDDIDTNKIRELAVHFGLMGENEDLTAEKIEELKNTIGSLEERANIIENLFRSTTNNKEAVDNYVASVKNAAQAETEATVVGEAREKQLEAYKLTLEQIKKATDDWAASIVTIGSSLSTMSMGMRSVDNIFKGFEGIKNKSLDAGQAIIQILSTVSMLTPVVTSGIKSLGMVIAGTALTVKTVAPIIAAVSVAIFAIIKAIQAFITTQKEAQEAITKSVEAYKSAKSDLESLQDELKTTADRIKELQDLAASGSISIIEQEELKKLQVQNDLLEQQVELKQALADIALKEAVDTITKNKDTAYTLTTENTDWAKIVDAAFGKNESLYKQLSGDQGWDNVLSVIKNRPDFTLEDIINQIGVWYPQQSFQAQNIRQAYENGAKAIYSEVEEVRKEAHTQWIAQNKETYEQLESDYATYLEGYKKGYVTESQLDSLRIKLVQQRKALLGEEKYNEFFVDKVLTALSNFDFHELAIGKSKELSEIGKELANQYGVSIQDLTNRASEEYDKAYKVIQELGIDKFWGGDFEKLSHLEYSVIANFKVSENSDIDKAQQFINYLQANAGTSFPIVFDIKTVTDEQSEALVTLASGEMIDDELISRLKEVYSGIQDIANFSAWSIEEQIKFLEDNVNQTRDNVLKQINILEGKKSQLEKTIDNNQNETIIIPYFIFI